MSDLDKKLSLAEAAIEKELEKKAKLEQRKEELDARRVQEERVDEISEGFYCERGKFISLDENFWASRFAKWSHIIWDGVRFYSFEDGLYKETTIPSVMVAVKNYISFVKRDYVEEIPFSKLLTSRAMQGVITTLQGLQEVYQPEAFNNSPEGVILVENGRLEIDKAGNVSFSNEKGRPCDLKTYRLPIKYKPATWKDGRTIHNPNCPTFNGWLKKIFKGRRDDLAQVSKLLGACLYQKQNWKKLIYVEGKSDTGKTQLAFVASKLVGEDRTVEFNPKNIGEKFETASFLGKVLCIAPELPPDFLGSNSADAVKAMVGGDGLVANVKYSNSKAKMRGNKIVFGAGNHPLRVKAQYDRSAWMTRLVYIKADGEAIHWREQDADFINTLFSDEEEASGILNFAIKGIQHILRARRNGHWRRSKRQLSQVSAMLDMSDSVTNWVKACVEADPNTDGDGLLVSEAWRSYVKWAEDNKAILWSEREFSSQAKAAILDLLGRGESHSLERGSGRGWRGLKIGA